MIFSRLADIVVKRHLAVVIIWLIILSISIPLVLNPGDIISYQETEFLDDSYESQRASAVIGEQFPSDSSNSSSMVLVVLDDNLTTPAKRDMILQLESDIKNDQDLKYFGSTTSIYDVYEMALESTIGPLAPNMTMAEEQSNLSLQMLFGIPDNYAMAYDSMVMTVPFGYFAAFEGVNGAAQMLFGIPAAYLQNYLTNANNNATAYAITRAMVDGMASTLDPMNATNLELYYSNFTDHWNHSFNVNPQVWLMSAIGATVNSFVTNPYMPPEYVSILTTVYENLTLINFMNPMNQSKVAYDVAVLGFAAYTNGSVPLPYIQSIYGVVDNDWRQTFTPYPTLNVSDRSMIVMGGLSVSVGYMQQASDITRFVMLANFAPYMGDPLSAAFSTTLLNKTYDAWDSSITNYTVKATSLRLQESLKPIHENFTAAIQVMGIVPGEQMMLINDLTVSGGSFGLSNYTNSTVFHQFTLDMFGEMSEITNMTFLQEVYDLGENASDANITSLAWKVVREGTVGNYPINLPAGVSRSLLGKNWTSMLVMVSFTKSASFMEADNSKPIEANVKVVRSIVIGTEANNPGLTIYVTGQVPLNSDMSSITDNDLQLIEPITITLVLVLMGIFFRSILGPVIPLASIGVALGISQAAVVVIATLVGNVHYIVQIMIIPILFGVGTDYSIFILARYREELLKGVKREDAMRTSITWAGESIATSGATVIIAFSAFSLSSFSMMSSMGIVLSLAVLIALLVSLTLVPAVALLFKGKIFWPISGDKWDRFRERYNQKRKDKLGGYFRKAAKFSIKHAVPVFVVAILISIPATYIYFTGATSFDFINGMGQTESVEGLNAMSDSFGAGRISPTQVVITFQDPVVMSNGNFSQSILNTIENVSQSMLSVNDNVLEINGPSRPNGEYVNYTNISSLPMSEQVSVVMQMESYVGEDNKTVVIDVIYREEPLTPLSMDTTRELRTELADTSGDPNLVGAVILVGGESAAIVDVNNITSSEFSNMELFVMIGIFIVLLIVLGSVILPLFAILSIGLSISWTLGVTVLLFDNLLGTPVLWILPIMLFVILMGLGMDYNIFILTRIREEAHKTKNHEHAIIEAADRTGGIITACALIMAGAFGSMMISSTTMLQEFGFALSFAVLLDAMVVRTYLTPAMLKILGPKWTWYGPKFLRRLESEKISSEKFEDKEF